MYNREQKNFYRGIVSTKESTTNLSKIASYKTGTLLQPFHEIASEVDNICYKPSNNLHDTKIRKRIVRKRNFAANHFVELHQMGENRLRTF
jgi:hypothetical protein